MSKTSISGVLWGQGYANGITAADLQEAKGFATGTGCEPPTGIITPVIVDESTFDAAKRNELHDKAFRKSKGWTAIGKETNESFRVAVEKSMFDEIQNRCDERRAADMLARGIARSRRSNSEGFGE